MYIPSYQNGGEKQQLVGTSARGVQVNITRANALLFVSENNTNTTSADAWISDDESFLSPALIHINRWGLKFRGAVGTEAGGRKRWSFWLRPTSGTAYYTLLQWD